MFNKRGQETLTQLRGIIVGSIVFLLLLGIIFPLWSSLSAEEVSDAERDFIRLHKDLMNLPDNSEKRVPVISFGYGIKLFSETSETAKKKCDSSPCFCFIDPEDISANNDKFRRCEELKAKSETSSLLIIKEKDENIKIIRKNGVFKIEP